MGAATVGHSVERREPRYVDGEPLCWVPECGAPPYRMGHCGRHYMDAWKHGRIVRPPVSLACAVCGTRREHTPKNGNWRGVTCGKTCDTLRRRYGVTPADYKRLVSTDRCDACSAPATYGGTGDGKLHIDHCHETGRIRGFLDNRCNQALGLLGEDPERILALARYLTDHTPVAPADVPYADDDPTRCELCGDPRAVRCRRGGKPVRYCGPGCRGLASGVGGRYGLKARQYQWLTRRNDGTCDACGRKFTEKVAGRARDVSIDHCHATGAIRGLLDRNCNITAGLMEDDPHRLTALATYIRKAR